MGAAVRFLLLLTPVILSASPETWVPARWTGGPLELERGANPPPADAGARETISGWYDLSTLDLLAGSPINCLLVTWSAGAADAVELRQRQLLAPYVAEARRRGIGVLGLIYPGADPIKFVPAAAAAHLDGLVLEAGISAGFADTVARAMSAASPAAVVIPIAKDPAPLRAAPPPIVAVEGDSTFTRNLAEMGIRAAPSSEPWIQSNIWLVRGFRLSERWRPVWISYRPEPGARVNYARAVADAAVAGGRWIVTLDDGFRLRLRRKEAGALEAWRGIGNTLRFAEEHRDWRQFAPYGNLGVIVDPASPGEITDEHLKLLMRRQVPYRMISRADLGTVPLGRFRALLATELERPSLPERKIVTAFAEQGGLVVAGPAWADVPGGERSVEQPVGRGRLAVYREPEPEMIAREMRELLSLDDAGVLAFNVPSVITYASCEAGGRHLLVQLLNYSDSPARDITIRVSGKFKAARLFTPEGGAAEVAVSAAGGRTEATISRLSLWGGVLLEGETP